MKKRILICIVLLLVISTTVCLVGCDTTDSLAKQQSTSSVVNYREMVEELKDALREATASNQSNIGAYATVYTDCLLNITCTEPTKSSVSGCQGTGFIITSDGYVLTNNHVVTYSISETDYDSPVYDYFGRLVGYRPKTVTYVYSSVTATFDSESQFKGNTCTLEVLYNDPNYDLALCKIVGDAPDGGWDAIPFYDDSEEGSHKASRGDQLLVLGNARGFGLSATAGLISATGKRFTDYPALTFIQTDAAINGGNSGGPAINIYGGLVGVVNSKFVSVIKSSYFTSEIEDVEGMGFAIELDCVKTFIRAAEESKSLTVSYKTISSTQQQTAQQAA